MRKNICVYCGASEGNNPVYGVAAIELGKLIATQGRRLIYGGGNRGLMGILANAVLEYGGEVIGVIPEKLVIAETAHHGLTSLEVVADMQIRKARMAEMADAFISLPGGTGTLEELYETWTAAQIGYHQKPVSLLNIHQFYEPMRNFLQHSVNEGFIRQSFLDTLIVSTSAQQLLTEIDNYQAKNLDRWLKK